MFKETVKTPVCPNLFHIKLRVLILCAMILSILMISFALIKIIYIVFFLLIVVVIIVILMKLKKKEKDKESRDIFISHIIKNEHSGYSGCMDVYKDHLTSKN